MVLALANRSTLIFFDINSRTCFVRGDRMANAIHEVIVVVYGNKLKT